MDRKEAEATDAIKAAMKALDDAIVKCGDAGFSFMNVTEPLLGARECANAVLKIATGNA